MNEFNYLDIYATKHIEYLLVVGFLSLFALIAFFISRRRPEGDVKTEREEGPR